MWVIWVKWRRGSEILTTVNTESAVEKIVNAATKDGNIADFTVTKFA